MDGVTDSTSHNDLNLKAACLIYGVLTAIKYDLIPPDGNLNRIFIPATIDKFRESEVLPSLITIAERGSELEYLIECFLEEVCNEKLEQMITDVAQEIKTIGERKARVGR